MSLEQVCCQGVCNYQQLLPIPRLLTACCVPHEALNKEAKTLCFLAKLV